MKISEEMKIEFQKIQSREYNKRNKDKIKAQKKAYTKRQLEIDPVGVKRRKAAANKRWYDSSKERILQQKKEYWKKKQKEKHEKHTRKEIPEDCKMKFPEGCCKEAVWERITLANRETKNRTYSKEYYQKNKKSMNESARKYQKKNAEKVSKKTAEYYEKNKEKQKEYQKEYAEKNKDKINKRSREYMRKRLKENIEFRVSSKIRSALASRLKTKNAKKSKSTVVYLGCTITEFMTYIEAQFKHGQTWDNHGKWHLDHKIPVSKYNLAKQSEIRKCFHYSNYQPLNAAQNLHKSARYSEPSLRQFCHGMLPDSWD